MQQLPYSDIKTKTGPEADTSSFLNDEKKTEQEKKRKKTAAATAATDSSFLSQQTDRQTSQQERKDTYHHLYVVDLVLKLILLTCFKNKIKHYIQ